MLILHDFFHLLDRHCTLDIDPLVQNRMAITKFKHEIHTSYIDEGHESEASGLLGALVLEDDAVFNLTKIGEIILELWH